MSYADSARAVFSNMLGTLDHLVSKARDAGMTDDILAQKLTEDMFPLELQFRVALNQVLLALNQVAGKSIPLEEAAINPSRRFATELPPYARMSVNLIGVSGRKQARQSI